MKKINILGIFLLLGLLMISCSTFLEEDNPSGVNSATFYATESGAESGVKACYTFMRQYYGKEEGYHLSELGTDIFTASDGCVAPEFDSYNISLSGSSATLDDIWESMYLALNTCNELIDKIPSSAMGETMKKIRLGEVHFLRAFYLWHIVEIWGDVVLQTVPTTSPQTEVHRSTKEEFYQVIKEDLKYAVDNLPEITTEYGRVTKPIAEAFSARIYLYTKDYSEALKYANSLISNGDYALANTYQELVDMATCNTVKENIFVCNYASFSNNNFNNSIIYGPNGENMTKRDGGNNAHMFFLSTYDKVADKNGKVPVDRSILYGRPFNRIMPTLYFLDLFDEKMDSRYESLIQQVWYCNNTKSAPLINLGDTAIFFTKHEVAAEVEATKPYVIHDRSYVYNADGTVKNGKFNTGFIKFIDPTRESVSQQSSNRDCVIIRLAEMYLIAAEAYHYQNNNEKAAEMINYIRRRAARPGHEAEMEVSPNDIDIDFILDERGRELCGEMQRWFDLNRTGKLVERVKLHNPDAIGIAAYHTKRPIPQSMLDAVTNKEEFKQNDGY